MHLRYACGVALWALSLCQAAHADALDDYFDNWHTRAQAALDSEPRWAPALNTISPRLTQVIRHDEYWQSTAAPADIENFGAGKGAEIIPFETTSFTFNFPPYQERSKTGNASGWADWPVVLVKQRLASAAPDDGNYVLTSYLTIQAPTGIAAFTNHAWVFTPGIGFGKGWDDFDLQGGITVALPSSHQATIGTTIASNLTAQYHVGRYLWPEVELNDTAWSGSPRDGRNQLFMTAGAILAGLPLFENYTGTIGGGYQFALTQHEAGAPALTPTYDHNFVLTLRIGY